MPLNAITRLLTGTCEQKEFSYFTRITQTPMLIRAVFEVIDMYFRPVPIYQNGIECQSGLNFGCRIESLGVGFGAWTYRREHMFKTVADKVWAFDAE